MHKRPLNELQKSERILCDLINNKDIAPLSLLTILINATAAVSYYHKLRDEWTQDFLNQTEEMPAYSITLNNLVVDLLTKEIRFLKRSDKHIEKNEEVYQLTVCICTLLGIGKMVNTSKITSGILAQFKGKGLEEERRRAKCLNNKFKLLTNEAINLLPMTDENKMLLIWCRNALKVFIDQKNTSLFALTRALKEIEQAAKNFILNVMSCKLKPYLIVIHYEYFSFLTKQDLEFLKDCDSVMIEPTTLSAWENQIYIDTIEKLLAQGIKITKQIQREIPELFADLDPLHQKKHIYLNPNLSTTAKFKLAKANISLGMPGALIDDPHYLQSLQNKLTDLKIAFENKSITVSESNHNQKNEFLRKMYLIKETQEILHQHSTAGTLSKAALFDIVSGLETLIINKKLMHHTLFKVFDLTILLSDEEKECLQFIKEIKHQLFMQKEASIFAKIDNTF